MDLKSINSLASKANSELNILIDEISKTTKTKSSPASSALFSHCRHAMERIDDIKLILHRLYKNNKEITKLHQLIEHKMPNHPHGVKYPKEVQLLMKKLSRITDFMKLDFESLYMFGDALLDQWSLIVWYLFGLKTSEEYNFNKAVKCFERNKIPVMDELWTELESEIIWLHSHLRFYRNKFVIHRNRPINTAMNYSLDGSYFKLGKTSPLGWNNDEKIELEINSLIHQFKEWLPNNHLQNNQPREVLKFLFNNIGDISNEDDRVKIKELVRQVGVTSVSFDIIGYKLFDFIAKSTPIILNIASKNINNINLGLGNGIEFHKKRFYESLSDEQKKNLEHGNKAYNYIWRVLNKM